MTDDTTIWKMLLDHTDWNKHFRDSEMSDTEWFRIYRMVTAPVERLALFDWSNIRTHRSGLATLNVQ